MVAMKNWCAGDSMGRPFSAAAGLQSGNTSSIAVNSIGVTSKLQKILFLDNLLFRSSKAKSDPGRKTDLRHDSRSLQVDATLGTPGTPRRRPDK